MIFNKKRRGQAKPQFRLDRDGKGRANLPEGWLDDYMLPQYNYTWQRRRQRAACHLVSEREGPDMTDLYFFSLTVINCFVLGFMCMVVNFSETLFPRQRRTFLLTFILISVISEIEFL